MKGFKVNIEQHCTHCMYEDEAFGSWEESYSNHFVSITETEQYPDVVTSLDIKAGDEVYVVWVQWSSGNSFGTGYAKSVEALAVFKDYKAACELAAMVELKNKDHSDYFDIKTSDGQEFYIRGDWCGYFEDLVSVEVEPAVIKKNLHN